MKRLNLTQLLLGIALISLMSACGSSSKSRGCGCPNWGSTNAQVIKPIA
jgi:hypothetical protein